MSHGLTACRRGSWPNRVGGGTRGNRPPVRGRRSRTAGLVTYGLDDIDWADEMRVFMEERTSFSPDALTGLEANLASPGRRRWIENLLPPDRLAELDLPAPERGRGEGALSRFGTGERPFDMRRV